jgi:hypothetical protein
MQGVCVLFHLRIFRLGTLLNESKVPHFPLHDFQGHVTQGVLYRANSN